MVVTPEGKLSRYLYGIDYSPKDLKFALMDSAQSKIGNPASSFIFIVFITIRRPEIRSWRF
jgi:protein SCO1/2